MERAAFLIEPTQERVGCLLNPESVVMRRAAGARAVQSVTGRFTGTQLADDPILFTGGGRTELELELLFDVSLAGSSIRATDVRDLTGPIWNLAENGGGDGYGRPALARFVWGKAWNLLGVVTDVAERLEQFSADGTPTRSWLRLRMRRLGSPVDEAASEGARPGAPAPELPPVPPPGDADIAHQAVGDQPGSDDPGAPQGERLETIAARYYGGRSWLWRFIAEVNDLDDAPWVPPGRVLRIPPLPPEAGG